MKLFDFADDPKGAKRSRRANIFAMVPSRDHRPQNQSIDRPPLPPGLPRTDGTVMVSGHAGRRHVDCWIRRVTAQVPTRAARREGRAEVAALARSRRRIFICATF